MKHSSRIVSSCKLKEGDDHLNMDYDIYQKKETETNKLVERMTTAIIQVVRRIMSVHASIAIIVLSCYHVPLFEKHFALHLELGVSFFLKIIYIFKQNRNFGVFEIAILKTQILKS
jgi:hypothetical protein